MPNSAATRGAWLLGPALVAGVAYLDPGNVASNMTAGARFGYLLVWVVVLGNAMAWLIQYLSAKLGVVTGRSLAELLGERIANPWARRAYWLQAELVAGATDVAEVIGGAIALHLLFGVPLPVGGLVTGAVSIALLLVQQRRGARAFELVVIGLLAVIASGFAYGVFVSPPAAAAIAAGLVPRFAGTDSVLLSASILGATIMPHAIYAHSALARDRFAAQAAPTAPTARPDPAAPAAPAALARAGTPPEPASVAAGAGLGPGTGAGTGAPTQAQAARRAHISSAATEPPDIDRTARIPRLLRATRWDVTVALVIAGTVNLAILLLAAANLTGATGTETLEGAHAALASGLGAATATLFAVGLLASGLASTAVGAYAGAELMHGLLRVRMPLLLRRLVTLAPAIALLAAGVDPTWALVLSQVVLSFGIPFALVPLVWLTARRDVLGGHRNQWWTTGGGVLASVFLATLNGLLLWLVLTGG
ncbi:MAG: Nramp family divalent metal transporter [Microbacterium sp.]